MPGAINILVYHPAKLIAVGLPKCGSSTLVEVFLRLSGFDPKPRRIRSMAVKSRNNAQLARAGLEFLQAYPQDIVPTLAANHGYRVFSVVRDPTSRIYSAYFNKLNRYTKQHRFDLYLRGQLKRLLSGPEGWRRVEIGNISVHSRLSFGQFLSELERLGPGIDPHFDLQVRLLDLENVQYNQLLDLRDLATGLPKLLADFGVSETELLRLPEIPQANLRKARVRSPDLAEPENLARIERIYADDLAQLAPYLKGPSG